MGGGEDEEVCLEVGGGEAGGVCDFVGAGEEARFHDELRCGCFNCCSVLFCRLYFCIIAVHIPLVCRTSVML